MPRRRTPVPGTGIPSPGQLDFFARAAHQVASAEPLASVDAARDETNLFPSDCHSSTLLFRDYQVAVPVCVS